MANAEHVEVVRQGAAAIAEWRERNAGERLDLAEANLASAALAGADLFRANLFGASLVGADLSGADLRRAELFGINLYRSDLSHADLRGANLSGANLAWADLRQANLSGVNLAWANLNQANLSQANLIGANLSGDNLIRTNLNAANLSGVHLAFASLCSVNLSQVVGLKSIRHFSLSSVGIDTLIASFRGAGNRLTPDLRTFFRGAGVPAELLDALPRIVAAVKYYDCFIAYGQPDVAFAQKLYDDLKARGLSCWLYALDATVGARTWQEIGQRRREAEKTVVLCSEPGLARPGVLKEIEEQVDEDPERLVPVSLDNRWQGLDLKGWGGRDLRPYLTDRNYADFANMRYEEALERLLVGLSRRDTGAT